MYCFFFRNDKRMMKYRVGVNLTLFNGLNQASMKLKRRRSNQPFRRQKQTLIFQHLLFRISGKKAFFLLPEIRSKFQKCFCTFCSEIRKSA